MDEYTVKYKVGDVLHIEFNWYKDSLVTVTNIKPNGAAKTSTYFYKDSAGLEGQIDCECLDKSVRSWLSVAHLVCPTPPKPVTKYQVGDIIKTPYTGNTSEVQIKSIELHNSSKELCYFYEGTAGFDTCKTVDNSSKYWKIVSTFPKEVRVLDSHGSFVVGRHITRTGKGTSGLPEGFTTKLLGIIQEDGKVYLEVIDADGMSRTKCGTKAWTPVIKAPSAPIPPGTYEIFAEAKVPMHDLCGEIALPPSSITRRAFFNHDDSADMANPQLTKETIMPTTDIKITINGKDIEVGKSKVAACLAPKTDLEAKKPYMLVRYNEHGGKGLVSYFEKEARAIKAGKTFLQTPAGLGCRVAIHKEIKVFTTNVPVVEVK